MEKTRPISSFSIKFLRKTANWVAEAVQIFDQFRVCENADASLVLRWVPSHYEIEEQFSPLPSGGYWGEQTNLLTRSVYYSDSSGPRLGRLQSEQHRDGTATLYDYVSDAYGTTVIEQTGELNPSVTNLVILNGTHTSTDYNLLGQITSRTTKWIQSGQAPSTVLAQETYTYDAADPLQRNYYVVILANRTNFFTFDCCGVATHVDQDGAATTYETDSLNRRVASTRFYGGAFGITTTNVLDAAGRVLLTKRIGTNGNALTLSQSQYDVLGRILRQTNALEGVTVFSETVSNNKLQRTTTFPDGGTHIETYYRDGRLEKVTGTAAPGIRYEYNAELEGGHYREFTREFKLDANGSWLFVVDRFSSQGLRSTG